MSTNEQTIQDPASSRGFFGHPVGLSTLFATEMWERFSFYGIRPLLILFMTTAVMNGGFGFERPEASAIVGIYASSVYLSSLPGGWIADRLFGLRRSIQYGAATTRGWCRRMNATAESRCAGSFPMRRSGQRRFSRHDAPSTFLASSDSFSRSSTVPLLPISPAVRSQRPTLNPSDA